MVYFQNLVKNDRSIPVLWINDIIIYFVIHKFKKNIKLFILIVLFKKHKYFVFYLFSIKTHLQYSDSFGDSQKTNNLNKILILFSDHSSNILYSDTVVDSYAYQNN